MSKFSKKQMILIGGLLLGGGLSFFIGPFVFSSLDGFHEDPRFRPMQDEISSSKGIDLRGLRELQASGGAAPYFEDLQRKLGHIKQPKILIDAKAESPGYTVGRPISFYRYDVSGLRLKHFIRRLYYTGTIFKSPDLITTPSEEARKNGFNYVSVHIGSRFIAPAEKIDEIVTLFDAIPKDTWIHIHCRNGHGRTSMLLTMLDIMRNAPTVSKDDIFKRQHLLGSVDFNDTTVWPNAPNYNKRKLEDRKQFVENFYEFIVQKKAGGIQVWSEWNRRYKKLVLQGQQVKKLLFTNYPCL